MVYKLRNNSQNKDHVKHNNYIQTNQASPVGMAE